MIPHIFDRSAARRTWQRERTSRRLQPPTSTPPSLPVVRTSRFQRGGHGVRAGGHGGAFSPADSVPMAVDAVRKSWCGSVDDGGARRAAPVRAWRGRSESLDW